MLASFLGCFVINVHGVFEMPSQAFSIEIRIGKVVLAHKGAWQSGSDGPKCVVDMEADGSLVFLTANVGKFSLIGDMELAAAGENGFRLLRWERRKPGSAGTGSCQVIVAHPKKGFCDLEIYVTMREESTLSVDEPEPGSPMTGNDTVSQYGAYVCCFVAAICALFFAQLMPAHNVELISGAAAIFIWGLWITDTYDRFLWRSVGFIAAGLTMCLALFLPGNAELLIEGVGCHVRYGHRLGRRVTTSILSRPRRLGICRAFAPLLETWNALCFLCFQRYIRYNSIID